MVQGPFDGIWWVSPARADELRVCMVLSVLETLERILLFCAKNIGYTSFHSNTSSFVPYAHHSFLSCLILIDGSEKWTPSLNPTRARANKCFNSRNSHACMQHQKIYPLLLLLVPSFLRLQIKMLINQQKSWLLFITKPTRILAPCLVQLRCALFRG